MACLFGYSTLIRVLCALCLLPTTIAVPLRQSSHQDAGSYDFVIVGGGTAGLALAARLSESGVHQVLVLEAGGSPEAVASYQSPGADLEILGSPIDWAYTTLPQPSLNGRQLVYHGGRCLGGSSAINGLTYGRGSAALYDFWESLGNTGWSWTDVLPYFIKSTTLNVPVSDTIMGQGYESSVYSNGPVQITYPAYSYAYPGGEAFIESLSSINISVVADLNAGNNIGAKQEPLTIDTHFRRSSSYDNYYMQAKDRPNLKVLPFSPVSRIVLEQQGEVVVATGVIYTDYASGHTFNVTARKEVVLSAGTFRTPQLLMLSGIGPEETLTKAGVQVYVANDAIGENLEDHTYFSINVEADSAISYDPLYSDTSKTQAASAEFENSQGPFIAPIGLSFGFEKLSQETLAAIGAVDLLGDRADQAHVEYFYESIFYPNYPTPQYTPTQFNTSYISLTAGLIAPLSKGSVSIMSNSDSDPPQIDLQYYSNPADQAIAIYAFKNLRKLLTQFAVTTNFTLGADMGEVSPGSNVASDEDILNYIRETAMTVHHASGTCAMLPREQGGVVDSRLKVYGVDRLRVVDASIFPVIPDQHTQGPTYMVAEKAAAMILEDYS